MTQEPQDAVPFKDSYWAVEKNLLAGKFPTSEIASTTTQMLERLLDVGVRYMVNLTQYDESEWRWYEHEMATLAAERNQVVEFRQFPIPDGCVPTLEFMQKILNEIDNFMWANGGAVYVHCWAGRGRTGTVVGCFLARNGVALGEDVLELLATLRRDLPNAHKESPENEEQRDMVRQWKLDQ